MTHLFYGFKNVVFDVSKYSKYTECDSQDEKDLSKKISKRFELGLKNYVIVIIF